MLGVWHSPCTFTNAGSLLAVVRKNRDYFTVAMQ